MNKPWQILFMGTSDFAVPALKAIRGAGYQVVLVVTQPDKPAGRGLELKASPVKKAALELGIEVFQPEKIKTPEALERLKTLRVDVAIVAAYGQILPSDILRLPKTACLNIHGSILPRYRGAAPIHYAVMNGDPEVGVTIMHMNEKMDEGDMLLVKKTPVSPEETTGEVHDRLAQLGAEGVVEALKLLEQGKAPRIPQDPTQATYSPSIKREFCRLDWSWPSVRIHNKVRGLSPWPAAETGWKGMDLKVFKAASEARNGKPGEVLEISKEGILVGAGEGSVLLKEIQTPGKRRMGAYDFTLGHPDFKVGEVLS